MTPRSAARVAEQACRATVNFRRRNPSATHEQAQAFYAEAYAAFRRA